MTDKGFIVRLAPILAAYAVLNLILMVSWMVTDSDVLKGITLAFNVIYLIAVPVAFWRLHRSQKG